MTVPPERVQGRSSPPSDAVTRALLERIRAGDETALEILVQRYLPLVRRWARGRLPLRARSLADTEDLVQDVLLQTVRHLAKLDYRGEEALQAYLRRSVANRIRQEVRRARRHPFRVELPDDATSVHTSPLEDAEAHELLEHYRGAIQHLRPQERELIAGRIELGCSFLDLASTLGLPSDEAARKAFGRAMSHLVEAMGGNEHLAGR